MSRKLCNRTTENRQYGYSKSWIVSINMDLSNMSISQVEKLWNAGKISTEQVDIYIKMWNADGTKFSIAKRMCNYIRIS